ncbi:unnamed protein product [Leptidea sinapis]|uniref:Histone deacetylase n=1 Tax=Leptidea sinapis TaxID=189913 RepID=A0A5E4PV38_9NEOP|nr:unnamed protein product [Leptidea sinapis]
MAKKKPAYIWDDTLREHCNRLPAVMGRASQVHNLITAYDLHSMVQVVCSTVATYEDLKLFHSELYLDHLKKFKCVDDEYIAEKQDEEFGIGYDCPPVSNMFDLVSVIAGSSMTAARCLTLGLSNVSINWCGGWHHAQRFGAEGFCYINDIVLSIEKLREKFPKVLYIDLDVHHGNGVQDAYNLSKSVFTLSFHNYEPGFYPGTGSIEEIGSLLGKGYTCNVPLSSTYSDDTLEYIFKTIFPKVYDNFSPDAIVVQCGADALARDPNGAGGLTLKGYCTCVQMVLDREVPTLLLGGGGYNHSNTARLWASLTALTVGVVLDEDIPEHDDFPKYGPYFTLSTTPLLTNDINDRKYLDYCIAKITDNLNKYLKPNTSKQLSAGCDDKNKTDKKKNIFHDEMNTAKLKATDSDIYNFNDE